ncbi:MAG: FtsW/RodA/SpoVE family cell cycle protein [Clostridia bacterium]|nr:FtsW/RodA/SpoVE family cell cycle protein [Clostridia bacterium]
MHSLERNPVKKIDWLTIILVLGLVAFGLVSLSSIMATPLSGTEQSITDYIDKLNMEYITRQAQNFLIAAAACIVVTLFDYEIFKTFAPWTYLFVLLLLLLLFAVGVIRGGTQGWFVSEAIERAFQPSELTKVALIVLLSRVVSSAMDKDGRIKRFKDIALCVAITAVPFALIWLQPDAGSAFVCVVILIVLLFVGRVSWKLIIPVGIGLAGLVVVAYFFLMEDYQVSRIQDFFTALVDPSMLEEDSDVWLALTAIGSGQMWGKGFFSTATLAQLRWIRARHTDYIFAGISEGVGFVGGTILILVYLVLAIRWIYLSIKARDTFGSCLIMGCVAMLIAHVFENIGMNIGLMPVTGIPLPFISYGGSNLLTNMIAVGIVLNVGLRRPMKKTR